MDQANEQDIFGQDLLSEALGQSGLNLDDYLGNAPGNVLSQSMLDVEGFGSNNFDFLDDINLNRDFVQDTRYIASTTSNNSGVASNYVSAQEKSEVSGVQQTFFQQPRTTLSLTSPGIFFQTPRQISVTSQNQQFVPKTSTTSGVPRLQSSSAPILQNLLNSGNINPSASNVTDTSVQKELTKKDVSRLWSNHDVSLNHVAENKSTVENENEDEEEDEEEELGHTDTYAEYVPSKLRIGRRHPDPVVETSSLSSVSPPDIWYNLKFPQEVIDSCLLSALQLEAVTYACQQHETFLADGRRAGFLIGDGAGVGKGRTVAGKFVSE